MPIFRKILRITFIVIVCLTAVITLAWGGFNAFKFFIYGDYYSIKENVCINPGLGDGFVCQGICVLEKEDPYNDKFEDLIIVSGYMANGSASRLYVTTLTNDSYFVSLKDANGAEHDGHVGGVAVHGNTLFVVDDDAIHVLPLQYLLDAQNGDSLTFIEKIPVNNQASFVYAEDDYLWVGEFHNGNQYITNHPYDTPNGKNHAIVCRYSYSDLTKPNKIYSIIDKAQGFCYTPDKKIVFSTSYGLADSVYYVFDDNDSYDSGLTLDGAPVYFLGNSIKTISGPAMSEGLDYYNGKILTLTESASNKYIFGKFFFANKIVSLDFNKN